jgi:ABC-type nickel/cobalt efflux system permease component RcnA
MPDLTLTAMLLLGFTLGLRHALDADHLAAVATFLGEAGGLRRSLLAGLSWGFGHALALGLLGGVLIAMQVSLPDRLARFFEMAVALMLILLGVSALARALRGRVHVHRHRHDGLEHSHLHFHAATHEGEVPHTHHHPLRAISRPLLVGGLHGLAGTGALVLLVLTSIPTLLLGFLYLGLFGVGSAVGMTLMSLVLAAPLVIARRRAAWLIRAFRILAGSGSLAIGLMLAWEIGIGSWLSA